MSNTDDDFARTAAAVALQQSEARLRRMIDAVPAPPRSKPAAACRSQEAKQCRQVADASASSSCAKSQDPPGRNASNSWILRLRAG
jgi:hypothetical protein